MFIGHYAAGFALKSVEKKASLGMLFIAVQLVDYLFFVFAPLGIEKFRLVENFTAINHFDLYFYPYTHGLLASFLWAALIYGLWRKAVGNVRLALVMALAVLSHWFTDLIVHVPDLPLLLDDSPKVGFGLWNNFMATVVVEVLLLVGALVLYLRSTTATGVMGKYAMTIFVALMVGLYIMVVNMPFDPNATVMEASVMGLVVFTLFTAVAFWLDRYRL
ncbi:hypothetical protein MNBD_ALPHA01-965 [hydrothermal vent metagenome]|uniref:Uncharacterized protein n=1 Tax=hydrothermal vent metagenome TaxID=652676 RepID=A0A3B0RQH9_9ZZZZ